MSITLTRSKSSLGVVAKIEGSVPFVSPTETLIEDNPNLFWDDTNNRLGIGTLSPNATLEVRGTPGANVGSFASGLLHVTNPSAAANANSVITGHNLAGGNKQLWYLGSTSGATDNIAFINRQNADLSLFTNNIERMKIKSTGAVVINDITVDGSAISSNLGDLDVTTQTGGVFKFTLNAFQSGQDATNYLEIGHGGSNSFINQVGVGGMDFRFAGVTKATFTSAGHLHLLTDTDQKHNLKIKTANNLSDSGIAWENSGGNFSQTIFRTDVGSNRSDLIFAIGSNANIDLLTNSFKIHGSAANEGKLEVIGALQISSGSPALDRVLTSDAVGNATWQVAPGAGGATAFAQLNSNVDQEPTVTTPVVITYNVQDAIVGLTHSTTVNPGEITVDTAGTYFVMPQPQVGKDSGGTAQTFGMFLQVDRGTGFADEANSNIKITFSDNTATDVIVSGFTIVLAVGDKIRMMQTVTSTAVGMGVKFTAAEVGPPTVPATPSIIFTMFRAGD